MIVIGADPHKRSHTAAAVDAATGELVGSETAAACRRGHEVLLDWGCSLGGERVWAVEDCRHVSGGLERFLVGAGERVVRVAPKLMAGARRSARQTGKSDAIDALAVARAALREGPERLPTAHLDEQALQIKLLLDHREDLVGERTRIQNRLRWHLHELWPQLEVPAGALDREIWLERLRRRLARAVPSVRVRVCRDQLRRVRELTKACRQLERELGALVAQATPQLLEIPGCGALTAAKLIAETAGAERFPSDAQYARMAGIAPIPASSGRRDRHRLHRGGNRQLNCAIHRIAVNQGRLHQPARDYLARKQAEGRTRREALRALKRHLARVIWRLLRAPAEQKNITTSMTNTHNQPAPPPALALT
jgi:transposase